MQIVEEAFFSTYLISKEEYVFRGKLCSTFINYLYLECIRSLDLLVLCFRGCGLYVDVLIFWSVFRALQQVT